MTLLIGYFLLSILFSFLCSIWEAVLLSITPSFVKRTENENPKIGKLLVQYKADIDKPLSAILSLNTIAHTVGAIGVGAQAGKLFGQNVLSVFGMQIAYESIIAAAMTLAILFLSEIIPKTIGANNWKQLAGFTANSLRVLLFLLKPLVWISTLLTKTLKKEKEKSVLSKQDFAAMADVVHETGEISKSDHAVIQNILKIDALTARDVMTPRTIMLMADEDWTLFGFFKSQEKLIYSRIPIYSEDQNNITGLILKDDLLQKIIEGAGDAPLKSIKRNVEIVKENLSLSAVLDLFHQTKAHLAVVVDEYGSLLGLLTLEDILETILGLEIIDETDAVSDLQAYARKIWHERSAKQTN